MGVHGMNSDSERILCANLTETIKSILLSVCEANIRFVSSLKIVGSVHINADSKDVLSCLLNEKSCKFTEEDEQIRRLRTVTDGKGVSQTQDVTVTPKQSVTTSHASNKSHRNSNISPESNYCRRSPNQRNVNNSQSDMKVAGNPVKRKRFSRDWEAVETGSDIEDGLQYPRSIKSHASSEMDDAQSSDSYSQRSAGEADWGKSQDGNRHARNTGLSPRHTESSPDIVFIKSELPDSPDSANLKTEQAASSRSTGRPPGGESVGDSEIHDLEQLISLAEQGSRTELMGGPDFSGMEQQMSCACVYCGMFLPSQTALSKHMQQHHSSQLPGGLLPPQENPADQPTYCAWCKDTVPSLEALEAHYRVCDKKFQCHQCNTVCASEVLLMDHMRIVHQRIQFTCAICQVNFRSRDGFKCHMNVVHNRSKSYPCRLCGKLFYTRQAAYQHKRTHHGINTKSGRQYIKSGMLAGMSPGESAAGMSAGGSGLDGPDSPRMGNIPPHSTHMAAMPLPHPESSSPTSSNVDLPCLPSNPSCDNDNHNNRHGDVNMETMPVE